MANQQGIPSQHRRRWREVKGLRPIGCLPMVLLILATLVLAIWPVSQTPLKSEDFALYGISPAVTKAVDRLRDKDSSALVIHYRLFLLYVTVGGIAAIGFIALGLRHGLKRGNRGDFVTLLFLQLPAPLLFFAARPMRAGRFSLVILAVFFCLALPVFWRLSRHLLHGLEAFETWFARKRLGK